MDFDSRGRPNNRKVVMPEEFPDMITLDTGGRRKSPRVTPNSVCHAEEHPGPPPGESPNLTVGGFYARNEPLHSAEDLAGDVEGAFRFSSEAEATSITETMREYLFPPRTLHKASFSDNIPKDRIHNARPSPAKSLRFRSHSISITDPVCRSAYESIPQSPAASFLAQFAQADDWKSRPKFEDGSVVDKYRVGKVLGRGSFSECREGVYTKDLPADNEKVAMKIVKGDEEHGQNLEDFDRELGIWKRLCHRNILPLLDFLRLDNALVAISPIAENGTLLDYLAKNGPFKEDEARSLFRQVCEAIAHMHTEHGIVHRDIKLDNILLDKMLRPYICDFGLSETVDPGGGTADDLMEVLQFADEVESSSTASKARTEDEIYCKGSLWYLSPEELDPDLLTDAKGKPMAMPDVESRKKTDIWSLGIVLYAMVTGKLPFNDDFLPRLQIAVTTGDYPPLPEHLSESLKELQSKLLTVDVYKRPCIDQVLKNPWILRR